MAHPSHAPRPHRRIRAIVRSGPVPLLILLLAATGSAAAQGPIYKSIDADGNVTYSSTPPEDPRVQRIETVEVDPGPSPAEQAEAERRMRGIESVADQQRAEQTSRRQARNNTVEAAAQALEDARADLEKAKERGPGDWQTIATGGRVPSASYLQRVQKAQQRVQAAEEALEAARAGGR
jgi:hypothetical protein